MGKVRERGEGGNYLGAAVLLDKKGKEGEAGKKEEEGIGKIKVGDPGKKEEGERETVVVDDRVFPSVKDLLRKNRGIMTATLISAKAVMGILMTL